MMGREDRRENDLFFTCSVIDYIARKSKNKRSTVVDILGRNFISKIYELADVYHCDDINRVCDDFMKESFMSIGNFDNISVARYSVPTHWDLGKVYKRLILDIVREEKIEIMDALFKAYHSYVSDKIEDFNSSFYYENPQNILNAYLYGEIE